MNSWRSFPFAVMLVAAAVATVPGASPAQGSAQGTPQPATPPAAPPAQGQPQQPVFRTRVDSVSVDVIVTDRQGQPVKDLKAEDFEIREAGKPQTVETFRFIEIQDGLDDPLAQRPILSMSDQQRETAREDNRLFVIFLDDYHTRLGNAMAIRQRLASWTSQLGPHDLVAVTYPLMPINGITFTRNHDEVASMMMAFEGRKYDYTPKKAMEERYSNMPPEQVERMRNDLTISALNSLCIFMGSLREGRKTILYVSEGMSNTLPVGVRTRGPVTRGPTGGIPVDPSAMQQTTQFFDSTMLLSDLKRVFESAARSNTAIYTLDPRGLAPSDFGIEDTVTQNVDRQMLNETTDLLRVIAGETDGRAIVGRNDPGPELQRMIRDNSAYYLLGYVSSAAPRDGKFHEIQVRVKRPGVEVRARKGYWAYSAEMINAASAASARPLPPADVTTALERLAAVADTGRRRLVAPWLGAERGPNSKALVTFAWELPAAPSTDPMESVDRVSITATSVAGETLFTGLAEKDAAAPKLAGRASFEAPPGPVTVRIVSENARGQRVDADEASIEVPDFTGTGPMITTPFVYRGRTVRDLQAVRASAAPLPVALRTFSRVERLLIRFQAYGPAGTQPTVSLKLLNSSGTSIATLPGSARTPAGYVEAEFSLSAFPPGDYLIEISAESNGEIARSLLPIRVTG